MHNVSEAPAGLLLYTLASEIAVTDGFAPELMPTLPVGLRLTLADRSYILKDGVTKLSEPESCFLSAESHQGHACNDSDLCNDSEFTHSQIKRGIF